MATAQVELGEIVVSTETIKPSSPTPQHLFTHTLSWIDQLIPPIHIGMVLFYPKGGVDDGSLQGPAADGSEKLRLLKRSLSDALTLYYPLAGRIGGVSTVNCTDEGIVFIEARVVSCPLSSVLQKKPADESETVDRLLPCSRSCTIAGGPLLIVKASTFPCGGLALGICLNHQVADGQSLAFFLKTWAAIARRVPVAEVGRPTLDVVAAAFPPLEMLPPSPSIRPTAARPRVTWRFVLDGSKICVLRDRSADQAGGSPQQAHRLTRVEAVTALLWRCLIRAYINSSSSFREEGAPGREFAAYHAVGLRARMEPPFPETAFGNIVTTAITPTALVVPISEPRRPSKGGVDHDEAIDSSTLRRLTEELTSAAIRGMDGAHIRETLQGPAGPFAFASRLGEYLQRGTRVVWYFSSMWGFPFYEADFGWGRPAWVAWAGLDAVQMCSGVGLTGRREGGGHMEVWVVLEAEEMARLRQDPELLSLLSSDPFPSPATSVD